MTRSGFQLARSTVPGAVLRPRIGPDLRRRTGVNASGAAGMQEVWAP
jgi:hypothetical protein